MKKKIDVNKLHKKLCPDTECSGYLYRSINVDREFIFKCKECGNYVFEADLEFITLANKVEEPPFDEELNLLLLNNL